MNRRVLTLALALAAGLSLPPEVHAQINPGVHVARAADAFGGVNGLGAAETGNQPVPLSAAPDSFTPPTGRPKGFTLCYLRRFLLKTALILQNQPAEACKKEYPREKACDRGFLVDGKHHHRPTGGD